MMESTLVVTESICGELVGRRPEGLDLGPTLDELASSLAQGRHYRLEKGKVMGLRRPGLRICFNILVRPSACST